MTDPGSGNAMTEIALALAMAFFSIMVLTMISMGTGVQPKRPTVGAVLAPAAAAHSPAIITPGPEDLILIHYQGRFFDRELKPIEPAVPKGGGRIILALSPEISVKEALDIRAQVKTQNLIVSTLGERWLKTLRSMPNVDK
ncbi:MAG: hypothetical protein QGG48_12610 [Desulfatiglandales bacterium]|nr:hypothetical protein [Desulfatiglandales bacterium]